MDEERMRRGAVKAGRRRWLTWVVAAAVVLAAVAAIKMGRHHLLAKRFFEVEAGSLYRSGALEAGPLRRVIDEHGIRTIVCLLNDEPGNPQQEDELKVAGEKGVRFIRVPMPGDGLADDGALDAAADAIAEAKNRPVLVHCAGGENRTGAAYAAYRMKHCGWSFEEAVAEGERFGLPLAGKAELVGHLRGWYEKRVATRPATAVGP